MATNLIVSQQVIHETPDGSRIIALELSEDAKDGLSVRMPDGKPFVWPYQYRVSEGDLVELPDGRRGEVYMIECAVGGHGKVISIRLDGAKPRFFGLIKPRPVRLADAEINDLTEIATREEIQDILADPEQLGLED